MPKDIKKLLLKADKLQMGKEMALAEEFIDINETIDEMSNKIDTLSEELKKKDYVLEFDKEELRGEKGDNGEDGIDGEDYILTEQDKKEIAQSIKVPVVEKVIEKTEVIRETPIVTNEIKEVAKYESPESLRDKLETLTDDSRLDASAIKNLPEFIESDKRIGFGSMLKEAPKDGLVYGRQNRSWVQVSTDLSGGGSETFETVSKNLKAYPYQISYSGGNIATITYDLGGGSEIIKTFGYTSGDVTSVTLSGNTPSGIDLVKTISYSGGNVDIISYL